VSNKKPIDWILATFSIVGIVFVYLFQDFPFLATLIVSEQGLFVGRKLLRVILNDLFMLLFIAVWFKDKQVTRLALLIQLIDSFVLLPIYLYYKLSTEGVSEISDPFLSQFHRLIINPTLMILLIPAVYFQKISSKK
jgi:exosortase F-associated protein